MVKKVKIKLTFEEANALCSCLHSVLDMPCSKLDLMHMLLLSVWVELYITFNKKTQFKYHKAKLFSLSIAHAAALCIYLLKHTPSASQNAWVYARFTALNGIINKQLLNP